MKKEVANRIREEYDLDAHRETYEETLRVVAIEDLEDLKLGEIDAHIKNLIKNSYRYKQHRFGDGSKVTLKNCYLRMDGGWYDDPTEIWIECRNDAVLETDDEVIYKLREREKKSEAILKKKQTQEKREKKLLETLKQKYGE